jgi:hypothetical protein
MGCVGFSKIDTKSLLLKASVGGNVYAAMLVKPGTTYYTHLGAGRIGFSRGRGVKRTTMIVSTSGSNADLG